MCPKEVPDISRADPAWLEWGSGGQVMAWRQGGRFLLGYVTEGLSLAETEHYIWVLLFIGKLVNRFVRGSPPPSFLPWVVYPFSVMKHIAWQFQFIHDEKCFLLWTFKGCLHNGNTAYLPRALGRKESNTSSGVKGGSIVDFETRRRSPEKGLCAPSVKQNFCL